ncbi:alanine dehydrogenase [Rhodococcus sp. SGAir0479]|uniref:alanine dehydrogenase n=1 Tax=Rhodococcus sp. SGAir0479 TaxID=2567884 RepID=UPI0010CD5FD8|nr:alanine dehydrogenase [Rhodococcus sp. SGAir0479]QCQ91870.1 alanine dehydrogenase [Rhodococcus sp. SGAir0479]
MRIGVPKEIKNGELRVALTPLAVRELRVRGHDVLVERGAGDGSSMPDGEFVAAGAHVVDRAEDVWADADLVVKVKEPLAPEYGLMRRGQVLFTYLHLAASLDCTEALLASGVTAIAYETVERADGSLPLLAPMSEVAGRLATQVGAHALQASASGDCSGRGVLLGGVPGVPPARVVVVGAGSAGTQATAVAVGMGARVTVLDRDVDRLRAVDARFGSRISTAVSTRTELESVLSDAELVIGAVLVHGARAPRLVSSEQVRRMLPGSVLVDIAIDQGGCFEDSRPTTHERPTYMVHNSIIYAVPNMPSIVPYTSTRALVNVTLPFVSALAENGWRAAMRDDPALAMGLSTWSGQVTHGPVALAHALPFVAVENALRS